MVFESFIPVKIFLYVNQQGVTHL